MPGILDNCTLRFRNLVVALSHRSRASWKSCPGEALSCKILGSTAMLKPVAHRTSIDRTDSHKPARPSQRSLAVSKQNDADQFRSLKFNLAGKLRSHEQPKLIKAPKNMAYAGATASQRLQHHSACTPAGKSFALGNGLPRKNSI